MVDLNKEIKKHQNKIKRKRLKYKILGTLVAIPLEFMLIKPYERIKECVIHLRNNYYRKKFKKVESKALEEMKRYLAYQLSYNRGACYLYEKFNDEDPDALCVKKFLDNGTFYYSSVKRKYSKMYGLLFSEYIEKNHLRYMNELVIWLLDQGCDIELGSTWSHYEKVPFLVAKKKKV